MFPDDGFAQWDQSEVPKSAKNGYNSSTMETLKMSNSDYANLARMLRKLDFFASMTVHQIDLVMPYITLCRLGKGEKVFKQGDKGDSLYIVYEGSVSVRVKKGFWSFSRRVATLSPCDFFGETALLSREPRNATVTCETESKLFVLFSDDFETVLGKNPALASEMKKVSEHRKILSQRTIS